MRVRPVEPEAADTGHARQRLLGPRGHLGRDRQRGALEGDVRAQLGEVQVGRDQPALDAECSLDETGHPGSGLEVAEVRLDGPKVERQPIGSTVDIGERVDLDRVSELRAGAVRLDEGDLLRSHAADVQRALHECALRSSVRRSHPGAPAVLVDGRTTDDRVDEVAVTLRVREPLQDDDAATLAPHETVGSCVEGLDPPVADERLVQLRQRDAGVRREEGVDPAADRQVGLAQAQALACLVDRDERRRACGVDCDARATQVEEVRDPPRRDGVEIAQSGVGVDLFEISEDLAGVLDPVDGQVDASFAAGKRLRCQPRVLKRLPAALEEEPLLRVHENCFTARDVEELVVEAVDAVEEPAPSTADLPRCLQPRVEEGVDIPAVCRNLDDPVAAPHQQVPVRLGAADTAREPAGHAHDRDGLRAVSRDIVEALLHPTHRRQRTLECLGRVRTLLADAHASVSSSWSILAISSAASSVSDMSSSAAPSSPFSELRGATVRSGTTGFASRTGSSSMPIRCAR